jgi:hypothetical protein
MTNKISANAARIKIANKMMSAIGGRPLEGAGAGAGMANAGGAGMDGA